MPAYCAADKPVKLAASRSMPSFATAYTAAELKSVAAYVKETVLQK